NTACHPNILTIAIVTTGALTGPKYEPANKALEARPFSPLANQNELNTPFEGYIGASPIPNKKRPAYNNPCCLTTPVRIVKALHHTSAIVNIFLEPNFSAKKPEGTCINAYPNEKNDANTPNCVYVKCKSSIIGPAIMEIFDLSI